MESGKLALQMVFVVETKMVLLVLEMVWVSAS